MTTAAGGKPVALRRRAEYHRVTFWHAQAVICTDAPDGGGGWFEEAVRCTHNHVAPDAAEKCADAIAAAVDRGRRPDWIVPLHTPRPDRYRP